MEIIPPQIPFNLHRNLYGRTKKGSWPKGFNLPVKPYLNPKKKRKRKLNLKKKKKKKRKKCHFFWPHKLFCKIITTQDY